jgi:methylenetetrahydrofolate reductase (NADPH)
MKMSLKDRIAAKAFVCGVEAVTTRGLLQSEGCRVHDFIHEVMDANLFDFVSITDNPGGNPHLSPETLGKSLLEKGHNVNIHVTCKDTNRNALESRAWRLASDGFTNIMALSGDYPAFGYRGMGRPVFDIDSVGLLSMYSAMNEGLDVRVPGRSQFQKLGKTGFLLSATVSPFKKYESEYLSQLFKMEKKIRAGAAFFIIQVGYDVRKWSDLLMYTRLRKIQTPIVANIYLLNGTVARLFHDNKIAGCVVTQQLLDLAQKQASSPDKGKSFFVEFAAKQLAVAQGMGFDGFYLGGVHQIKDVLAIREKLQSYSRDDWKDFYKELSFPQKDEFYLHRQDDHGFAVSEFSERYKKSNAKVRRFYYRVLHEPPVYRLSRWIHILLFAQKSPIYHLLRALYKTIDGKRFWERFFHSFERAGKRCLYGCRDCGDCSLMEMAYLCPEGQCSKNQRNGPCGGSYQGRCEVGDKLCLWHRAYLRLKLHNREREPFDGKIAITDAKWLNTSAWQNYFLKRDHLNVKE